MVLPSSFLQHTVVIFDSRVHDNLSMQEPLTVFNPFSRFVCNSDVWDVCF